MDTLYKTKMSANSSNYPADNDIIEDTHTSSEIIHHANEVLAQQMGLELCSFVGLEERLLATDDGDMVIYVDQAGNRVEFTEELQLKAAIAVLNTNKHYFEAIPATEGRASEGRSSYA